MIRVLLLWCFFFINSLLNAAPNEIVFVISPAGNDAATGSLTKPFRTFDGAINRILSLKNTTLKDKTVMVYVRQGTYSITSTFRLNERCNFSETHPLIFGAYNQEKVEINGGITVPLGNINKLSDPKMLDKIPQASRSRIYVIDLKKLGISNYGEIKSTGFRRATHPSAMEVFINKQPCTLSRWPNDTANLIKKVLDRNGKFLYEGNRPERWTKAKDAWIGGTFYWAWAEDQLAISNIDIDQKTITTKEGTLFGFTDGADFRRWYVFNLLEELDEDGEYYIDREEGKLYFYKDNKSNIKQFEVSLLESPMVSLLGCKNVIFRKINFENTRGMGAYLERTTNCKFEKCTFRNMGMVAADFGKGIAPFSTYQHDGTGTPTSEVIGNLYEHLYDNSNFDREAGFNNGLSDCEIYNMGCGGVVLGGGNRNSLTPATNYVMFCNIYNVNRLGKTLKSNINIDGVGNIVRNNHLHQAAQTAIIVHGNNHFVEYNEIENVCREAEDMGAIYMGNDPSETGNVFNYNYLHHIQPKRDYRMAGMYFDDGQLNETVTNNIFYKVGSASFGAIFIHGGHHLFIDNNIFIDCPTAIGNVPWDKKRWDESVNSKTVQDRLYQSVDILTTRYKSAYPSLENSVKQFTNESSANNNIAYQCTTFCPDYFMQKNNWVTNVNPGFTFKNGNILLSGSTPANKDLPSIQPLQPGKIGLQKHVPGNN